MLMFIAGLQIHLSDLTRSGKVAVLAGALGFALTMGLGAACGAFLGGVLYESFGSAVMFQWAGLAVLLGLIFFVVAGRKSARLKPTLTKP